MNGGQQTYEDALEYATLMARYGVAINNYCMLRAENLQEAERLALAAEEAVWKGVRKMSTDGRSESEVRHWLFKVVRNAVTDCLRQRKRWQPLDEQEPYIADGDSEASEIVDELTAYLPQESKELIDLVRAGYSMQDIAEMKGATYVAIRHRMQRTIQKLKEIGRKIYG